MDSKPTNIWIVSRECDGIAEAGGVKNVTCSLSEGLVEQGIKTTLFIPRYGCTNFSKIKNYINNVIPEQKIIVNNQEYIVSYDGAETYSGVKVIFIVHQIFSEKNEVYTYSAKDEELNASNCRGIGFHDTLELDVLFQKAVVFYTLLDNQVDLIHCHDATTAIIPALTYYANKDVFSKIKYVVTIHNAGPGYHHDFSSLNQAIEYTNLPVEILQNSMNYNRVEPFLIASKFAEISTVSPWYAEELINPANSENTANLSVLFEANKTVITGITNGIDYSRYEPQHTDISLLPFPFNPLKGEFEGKISNRNYFINNYCLEKNIFSKDLSFTRHGFLNIDNEKSVLFCFHGRIVRQKGIDLLTQAAKIAMDANPNIKFLILGQGEVELENNLISLSSENKGGFLYFQGYEKALSRLVVAVSDFILLPSRFEPCGLEDFIAQFFGTIPIAHATGGLNKILNEKTGFLYEENTPQIIANKIISIADSFKLNKSFFVDLAKKASNYVQENYSWKNVIENYYIPFYSSISSKDFI